MYFYIQKIFTEVLTFMLATMCEQDKESIEN